MKIVSGSNSTEEPEGPLVRAGDLVIFINPKILIYSTEYIKISTQTSNYLS